MGLVRVTFTLCPSVHVPAISIVRLLPVPCRFEGVMPLGKLMLASARVVGLALKFRVSCVVVVVFAVPLADMDWNVIGVAVHVVVRFTSTAKDCVTPPRVTEMLKLSVIGAVCSWACACYGY